MNREEFSKACNDYAVEVGKLCRDMSDMTQEEYDTIEHVYTWYPTIGETTGKRQVAMLYMELGIVPFIDMYERAYKARQLDHQTAKERVRHKTEMEQIQEEQKKLTVYAEKKEAKAVRTSAAPALQKVAAAICPGEIKRRLNVNEYKDMICKRVYELSNYHAYSYLAIQEELEEAIGCLNNEEISKVAYFLLCTGDTTEDEISGIINFFMP